jgi:hypothetical protein
MQRDMELIRKILQKVETDELRDVLAIPGFEPGVVGHHVYLLGQAGLLEVVNVTSIEDSLPQASPLCLTWEGHDFLNASRDDNVWSKVRHFAKNTSFVVMKQLLEKAFKGGEIDLPQW